MGGGKWIDSSQTWPKRPGTLAGHLVGAGGLVHSSLCNDEVEVDIELHEGPYVAAPSLPVTINNITI